MSAREAADRFFDRLAGLDDPSVFISVVDRDVLYALAAEIDAAPAEDVPLRGLVFAAKDNIDVAGLPTTAGCPGFAFEPERSAVVVARLLAAGALPVGKTNLDQFATGLVGTRSPYGTPTNPLDASLVPGGSSSGSAVAVARSVVDFALGTDTAGSGRVPAAMCGVVGLKPSFGRLPCTGVVPAVRSVDCVSIFARSVDLTAEVMAAAAGPDVDDPFSRSYDEGAVDRAPLTIGVLSPEVLAAHGCTAGVVGAYRAVAAAAGADPAVAVEEFDPDLLFAAGDLLYGGPFVAERTLAVGAAIDAGLDGLDPVVAGIISAGGPLTATDAFAAQYRLAELRAEIGCGLAGIDALLMPTIPSPPTIDDVAASPVQANTAVGRFTTFTNLLDMCGLTLPAGSAAGESVSFYAAAGRETTLRRLAPLAEGGAVLGPVTGTRLVVAGAHLKGQPLAHQLEGLGAVWEETTTTAPSYRLFALPGGPPFKPALVFDEAGATIEVDVWRISPEGLGRFLPMIPAPLGLGQMTLADGSTATGFIAEPRAVDGAEEITGLGGWRPYVSQ